MSHMQRRRPRQRQRKLPFERKRRDEAVAVATAAAAASSGRLPLESSEPPQLGEGRYSCCCCWRWKACFDSFFLSFNKRYAALLLNARSLFSIFSGSKTATNNNNNNNKKIPSSFGCAVSPRRKETKTLFSLLDLFFFFENGWISCQEKNPDVTQSSHEDDVRKISFSNFNRFNISTLQTLNSRPMR